VPAKQLELMEAYSQTLDIKTEVCIKFVLCNTLEYVIFNTYMAQSFVIKGMVRRAEEAFSYRLDLT